MTVLAVLLSGAMWFLSSGINHIWILAWFAPVPLLIVLLYLRLIPAVVAAFAASAIGALSWLVAYGPLAFALVPVIAIPFTVVATMWRAIARRAEVVIGMLAYPALVVSAEFAFSLISPHGTLGNVSYSQGDLPVILQIASVTGIWGISFVLSLVPAALAFAWHVRQEPRLAATVVVIGVAPATVGLVFGTMRLAAPSPTHHVNVGLAASDATALRQFSDGDSAEISLSVVRAFADHAGSLATQGADVVVLPEKFVTVRPEYANQVHAVLSATARKQAVTIVAGFYVVDRSHRRNVAHVFAADGNMILEYDKRHLVPGIESGYTRGNAVGIVSGEAFRAGVAICKDLDFVPLGREYAQAGIGILYVPAWDFGDDRWLHGRMALMRSVEGGYALVRTATEGLLTVSDARGRVIAERSSAESADVLLTATVPVSPGGTFYSRTGDWFPWMCVGTAVVAAFIATFSRKRGVGLPTPLARA
jgi:apolipoprotein N-acyltransferase